MDALALDLPAQVPERRVETCQRAIQMGAVELELALGDLVDQSLEVADIPAERMGSHLPVEHPRRDVGVVGGDLAPPLRPVVGPHPNESDVLVPEALDADDLHS